MPTFRARGIVIKKKEVREADRIFTIFTDNLGKISVYGRGIGKIDSKLSGHLDLFMASDLMLAQGRNMPTVVYAKTLENFKNIRESLTKTGIAFYAAEILDKFVLEEYKDTRIFRLLYCFFQVINQVSENNLILIKSLFLSFELKLLKLLGYSLEIKKCVQCGCLLSSGINYFDFMAGGAICFKCKGSQQNHQINKNCLDLLNLLAEKNFDDINNIKIKNQDILFVKEILDQHIVFLLERKLKSPDLIQKIDSLERKFGL